MDNIANLEKLSPVVKKVLRPYLENFIRLNADNLLSLMLYGSATGEDFVAGVSDINILAVFKRVRLEDLKKNLKLIAGGRRKNISAPLILSRAHIDTSKDTFPIEFLEIKDNYLLLYGEDIFSGIVIDQKYLRLFCEEQLKGKLIRIRQTYLEKGLKKKGIEAILKRSFNSLFPVFRSLLRLKDITPPAHKEKVVVRLEEVFGIKAELFIALLRDKKNDEKISGRDIELFLKDYLEEIEKIAYIVDRL